MSDTVENKRIGREKELRRRVSETADRYESVFNTTLTPALMKEFLDDCSKQNRLGFLRDRLGVLSDADVEYLRAFLKEKIGETPKSKAADISDTEVEDIDEEDVDLDELNA